MKGSQRFFLSLKVFIKVFGSGERLVEENLGETIGLD
jgi:hypothetical protein